MFEHYLFGKFIKSSRSLTAIDVKKIINSAKNKKETLKSLPVDEIITVLSNAGKNWANPEYHLRKKAKKIMPELTGFSPEMVEISLKTLSEILKEETLKEKISLELGQRDYLDKWIYCPDTKSSFKAEPLGVLLHVLPGNVFIGGIDSLINGLITKNINILKVSGADPVFPLLFAQSIKEVDKSGLIWKNFAILSFTGGEKQIEDEFKNSCNGIIVWGGEEAIKSWRKEISLGVKLIEYGPRLSFAIITGQGFKNNSLKELAKKMGLDIVMWEQRACSSPQVIYLEKNEKTNLLFLKELEKAMKYYAKTIPQGKISEDEKTEITKYREMAKIDEILNKAKLLKSKNDTSWTIIYKESPEFELSCLNRTILVKTYKNLKELQKNLSPFSAYFQGVSVAAGKEEFFEISNLLTGMGVTRITKAGGLHTAPVGAPHEGTFQTQRLINWVIIESHARGHSSFYNLKNIFDFAKEKSKFYKNLYKNLEINKIDDFKKLPLIDKENLYKNSPPRSKNLLTSNLESSYIFASGGTSGDAKFCPYTYEEFEEVKEDLAFILKTAGIEKNDVAANLFMAGNLWTSFLIVNKALERVGCTTLPIGGNADMDLILKYIRILRPNAFLGLPSVIIGVAQEIEKRKIPVKIKKILYGGEHLSPPAQNYLRKVLHAELIISAGYASVDAGTIGYQCKYLPGTIHHLLSDTVYLEIIDPVTQKILPDGGIGEIVVTCLKRKLMPIIRYRTGDLGRIIKKECGCSCNTLSFELLGRCDDIIRLGTVSLTPAEFEKTLHGFKELGGLFQIVGTRIGKKDALILKAELKKGGLAGLGLEEKIKKIILKQNEELREALEKKWLADIKIEILNPGGIPRVQRTGKIKKIIDLRKQPG